MNKEKALSEMTSRAKVNYYQSRGYNSLAKNRIAITKNHEHKGLNHRSAKLSSKNFDKLMSYRGIEGENANALKQSFSKWSSEEKSAKRKKQDVKVKHARAGEAFKITSTKGKKASGIFVSKRSLGRTPEERINRGSLPSVNKANVEKNVYLAKSQNTITGKIAPQNAFRKADRKRIPRDGGGTQTITDGGYRTGAVKDTTKKRKR